MSSPEPPSEPLEPLERVPPRQPAEPRVQVQAVGPGEAAGSGAPNMGCNQLFWTFTHITMLGFGGVLPWMYRVLVEQRQVLSPDEFRDLLALGQVLPGPSICNMAVMVGYRHAGVAGGASALAGMMLGPMVLMILLGLGYASRGPSPRLASMLSGMSAAAAGLIVVMALRMATGLPRSWRSAVMPGLALLGITALHLPLWLVLAGLAPVGMLLLRADRPGAERP